MTRFISLTLVDDRIHGDGGLAGLTVSDDQLTLSPSDRNHGVDGLDAGLQRLVDGLPVDNARRFTLQRHLATLTANLALAINRIA